MQEWVWTLKDQLIGLEYVPQYDWVQVSPARAVRLHEQGSVLAACLIDSVVKELDTISPDSERALDLKAFLNRYWYGMPLEARQQYGTYGIEDLCGQSETS